jgi:8-amino-7-oxononanoate synthase
MEPDAWCEELASRLAAWKDAGLARRLRLSAGRGVRVRLDGRPVVSFATNDYLDLSSDPRVLAAAQAALEASGAGATASRLLGGHKPEHARLEEDLARYKGAEAALVFPSGYQTAVAALSTLGGRIGILPVRQPGTAVLRRGAGRSAELAASPCTVLLDRAAHACLIDGARLSGARLRTFPHNDVAALRQVLAREAAATGSARPRLLVVIESLYSMDGDVAPVAEIHAAARAVGAWLFVDEAHATGVLGPRGRGVLADVFPGELPPDVLAMGTLSKALGSQGGFLCASRLVIETLIQSGRPFLFTTGLAPAAAAAARAALSIAQEDEARRCGLLQRAQALRASLRQQGWQVLGGPGPILPILAGDEDRAVAWAERLLEQGLWAPAVRYPTVRKGAARLRVSLTAGHSPEDLRALKTALQAVAVTWPLTTNH